MLVDFCIPTALLPIKFKYLFQFFFEGSSSYDQRAPDGVLHFFDGRVHVVQGDGGQWSRFHGDARRRGQPPGESITRRQKEMIVRSLFTFSLLAIQAITPSDDRS